jgi:hypothetical protein
MEAAYLSQCLLSVTTKLGTSTLCEAFCIIVHGLSSALFPTGYEEAFSEHPRQQCGKKDALVYRWKVLCFKISRSAFWVPPFFVAFSPFGRHTRTTIPAKCPPAVMNSTHVLPFGPPSWNSFNSWTKESGASDDLKTVV